MITTQAWVIKRENTGCSNTKITLEEFSFKEITEEEILVEPLFGCWEGNMEHAINRSPIDLCTQRDEDCVVIGNAGVVRVLQVGKSITDLSEGDIGILFCNAVPDKEGYPELIFGYDAPGTIGLLSKKTKLKRHQFIPIPPDSPASLPQWAAFSLRYVTAWANWRVAFNTWKLQNEGVSLDDAYAVAWGGGVSLAELELAKSMGFNTAMITSKPKRIALLGEKGIQSIDRTSFNRESYEQDIITSLMDLTNGKGVNIFIDNIGSQFQGTLKALARQGVITTSGWRSNMIFPLVRSSECIHRHTHVFTHYARLQEGQDAVNYAVQSNWFPVVSEKVYGWEGIPQLADDYANGKIESYFPIFSIN